METLFNLHRPHPRTRFYRRIRNPNHLHIPNVINPQAVPWVQITRKRKLPGTREYIQSYPLHYRAGKQHVLIWPKSNWLLNSRMQTQPANLDEEESPAWLKLIGMILSLVLFVLGGVLVFYHYITLGMLTISSVPVGYCFIQGLRTSECTWNFLRFLRRICCCHTCRTADPSTASSADSQPPPAEVEIPQPSGEDAPMLPEVPGGANFLRRICCCLACQTADPPAIDEVSPASSLSEQPPQPPTGEEVAIPQPYDENPPMIPGMPGGDESPMVSCVAGPSTHDDSGLDELPFETATVQGFSLMEDAEVLTMQVPPSVDEPLCPIPSNVQEPSLGQETPFPNVGEECANPSRLQETVHSVPSNVDERALPGTSTIQSSTDA